MQIACNILSAVELMDLFTLKSLFGIQKADKQFGKFC
jgi:hypothetical protein